MKKMQLEQNKDDNSQQNNTKEGTSTQDQEIV